ncbi:hypothetical protein VITU9109_26283 [Vibrio tubiashii ATCC 19109]|uniref:Uncharacterized protein n=1 Tax=Vibrio tubiashii ATCC 19109 TaxID=1051646 RepID=A0ABP2LPG3_9VIBR|nr:hypothetical protein VITU9109_26283 [Vibrio tubiashii ATCC 19109]
MDSFGKAFIYIPSVVNSAKVRVIKEGIIDKTEQETVRLTKRRA